MEEAQVRWPWPAPDPDLLVLDDPTLGLDTVVRRDFLESIIHLIQGAGRTVFFSSHMLSDVERVADRIGIMVDGVLRVDCPTDHFKSAVRRVARSSSSAPRRVFHPARAWSASGKSAAGSS